MPESKSDNSSNKKQHPKSVARRAADSWDDFKDWASRPDVKSTAKTVGSFLGGVAATGLVWLAKSRKMF